MQLEFQRPVLTIKHENHGGQFLVPSFPGLGMLKPYNQEQNKTKQVKQWCSSLLGHRSNAGANKRTSSRLEGFLFFLQNCNIILIQKSLVFNMAHFNLQQVLK